MVVCIDKFQQIDTFTDSLEVQKRIRGVWLLQQQVTYCLLGSKKHLLSTLFQDKRMPFYQFGDIQFLQPIPPPTGFRSSATNSKREIAITDGQVGKICKTVQKQSYYVQQLAWNVMLSSDKAVTEESLRSAINDFIGQNSILFMQQTESLSAYQKNLLRALAAGESDDLTSAST